MQGMVSGLFSNMLMEQRERARITEGGWTRMNELVDYGSSNGAGVRVGLFDLKNERQNECIFYEVCITFGKLGLDQ